MALQETRRRPLIGYFNKHEFQEIAGSRIGAKMYAEQLGYDLVFINDWRFLNPDELDGLIYAGRIIPNEMTNHRVTLPVEEEEERRHFLRVKESGIPIVCAHSPYEGVPSVLVDNAFGMTQIVEHLYELGFRRYVYVRGTSDAGASKERFDAFNEALKALKVEPSLTKVITRSPSYFIDRASISELLSVSGEPTAVVCWNDVTAAGVIDSILHSGLCIPEDFAVTGFDNSVLFEYTFRVRLSGHVPITSSGFPAFEVGKEAMRQLHEAIGGRSDRLIGETRVKGRLFVRQSTVGRGQVVSIVPSLCTPVDDVISLIYNSLSHVEMGTLESLREDLKEMYQSNGIDLSTFRAAVTRTFSEGVDLFTLYPLYVYVYKRLFYGEAEGGGIVAGEQLIDAMKAFLLEKDAVFQTYQYSVCKRFDESSAELLSIDKDDSQEKLASKLRSSLRQLGNDDATLILFSNPIPDGETMSGTAFVWDLMGENGVSVEVVRLRSDLSQLMARCQRATGVRATDLLVLGSNGFVHGVLLLDIKSEYWIFHRKLGEMCSTMLYNFSLFEAVRSRSKELLVQKKMADAANEAKTEFLNVMSHELRTPLNCVVGMSELMMTEEVLEETHRGNLGLINKSGMDLLRIIGDILDFSDLESDEVGLARKPLDLRKLIEDVLLQYKEEAEKKGLRLSTQFDSSLSSQFVGDHRRVGQVFSKLISNAIKYTDSGDVIASVRVLGDCEKSGVETIQIQVKDTGVGIPPNSEGIVFGEFAQVESGVTRSYGGTGLGLAIASRLVKKMGGRIWFESELGEGSTFFLELPFGVDGSVLGGDVEFSLPQRRGEESDSKKILVVDDDSSNAAVAMMILKREGYLGEYASGGRDAIETFRDEQYDLVLMDIEMPVLDGWQVTREMRRLEEDRGGRRRIPIIALTAHALHGYEERCLSNGMNGYITKPIDRSKLLEKIAELV